MANRTIQFDIKAFADTKGLDEFASELKRLKGEVEPVDRILGEAVKQVNEWAGSQKVSADNTSLAVGAINALKDAMTAGSSVWKAATQSAGQHTKALTDVTNAAMAAKAALESPASTQSGAAAQIANMRRGLADLNIQSEKYVQLLNEINQREAVLGRRTGRAAVIAGQQAYASGMMTAGYGSPERLQAMPDTGAALRQRMSELNQELPHLIRGSEEYFRVAREMSEIERELKRDLTGTTQALRQRSAATQEKINAVRAYNRDAIADRVAAGLDSVAARRRTEFGDVPQVFEQPSGGFIAPPATTSRYGTNFNQHAFPIGPVAPSELFQSIGGIGVAGNTASLQLMGRSYREVAAQIREASSAAGGSTTALQAERRAWEQLRGAIAPATREYRQATREIERIDAAYVNPSVATARQRLEATRGVARISGFREFSAGIENDVAIQKSIRRNEERRRRNESRFQAYESPIGPVAPSELFQSIGGIGVAGNTASLQLMGRSYREVAAQIREASSAAGGSTTALQAERRAWEQLRGAIAPATREYRQATREIERIDRRVGDRNRFGRFGESAGAIAAGGFFGGPEGLAGSIIGTAVGGPAAALGGATIGASVGIVRQRLGGFATYAADLAKLEIGLKGVTKSAEDYQFALAAIQKTSNDFNIPIGEATKNFTRLTASVIGAGGSVAQAETVFRNVTAAIKATGGSAQDVDAALLAMSQVFSKGKVSAEELSGQLGERLAGAVVLFAKATGRSTVQLADDLKKGTVGLNDLLKFTESLGPKYESIAKKIAASTEDAGARARLATDQFRRMAGEALIPVGAAAQQLQVDFLKAFGPSIVEAIKASALGIQAIGEAMKLLNGPVGVVIRDILIYKGALLAVTAIGPRLAAFHAATTAGIAALGGSAATAATRVAVLAGALKSLLRFAVIGIAIEIGINGIEKLITLNQQLNQVGTTGTEAYKKALGGAAQNQGKLNEELQRNLQIQAQIKKEQSEIKFPLLTGRDEVLRARLLEQQTREAAIRSMLEKAPEKTPSPFSPSFGDPSKDKSDSDAAARKAANEAAAKERLAMQLYNDQLRREEGLAQNRIKLEDAVFRHRMELMRKAADNQRELDDVRLQNLLGGMVGGAGPAAAVVELFRDLRGLTNSIDQERQNLSQAQRDLTSAQQQAAATARTESLLRREEGGGVGGSIIGGRAFRGGARTGFRRDRDAEQSGYDVVLPGGVGAPIPSPVSGLRITGTGFQGSGRGFSGRGYGRYVTGRFTGQDGKQYELLIGHLDKLIARVGDVLQRGAIIGNQGETGHARGTHATTHVNALNGGDPWKVLRNEIVQPWIRGWGGGGTTRTLANNKIVRTTGLAGAAARNVSDDGTVQTSEAQVAQQRELLELAKQRAKLLSPEFIQKYNNELLSGVRQQQQALEDSNKEFELRNRLISEGAKPEQIEFEISKARALSESNREIKKATEAVDELVKTFGLSEEQAKPFRDGIDKLAKSYQDLAASAEAAYKAQNAPGVKLNRRRGELRQALGELGEAENAIVSLSDSVENGLSNGFSQAVTNIVSGTGTIKDAIANMLQSIAQEFLNYAAKILAKQAVLGILGLFGRGLGGAVGGGAGGFASVFAGSSDFSAGFGITGSLLNANGNAFANGIRPFASGGVVDRPTLFKFANGGAMSTGVMGEAGPEAILPLRRGPNGKLGVQAAPAAPIDVRVETTVINGVEYATVDQLRQATKEAAERGRNMAYAGIQQSVKVRRRLGVG